MREIVIHKSRRVPDARFVGTGNEAGSTPGRVEETTRDGGCTPKVIKKGLGVTPRHLSL